jgi:ribonuclease VapC
MFLDASAIVAILAREADADESTARIALAETVLTSPIAIFEAVLALGRIRSAPVDDMEQVVADFLTDTAAEIVTIDAAVGTKAVDAFMRYGKGPHPAGLNMGDCFAHACARHFQVPLLFKGNDFEATDIQKA